MQWGEERARDSGAAARIKMAEIEDPKEGTTTLHSSVERVVEDRCHISVSRFNYLASLTTSPSEDDWDWSGDERSQYDEEYYDYVCT
eukprot:scaffold15396_cov150-Skeletonema_marinoi.AAC.3